MDCHTTPAPVPVVNEEDLVLARPRVRALHMRTVPLLIQAVLGQAQRPRLELGLRAKTQEITKKLTKN